jgi:signal transduction histidine kinase
MATSVGRRLSEHFDATLVVALAAAAQVEIWTSDHSSADKAALAAAAVVGIGALAWRRRAPLAVLGVMLAAAAASAAVVPPSGDDPIVPVVGLFVAIYSAGAYAGGRAGIAGGIVTIAVTIGIAATDPEGISAGGIVFFLLVFGGTWLFGRAIRRRRQSERHLARQAEVAVAEERARIARELHDIVAHSISVIVVQARGGRRALADSAEEASASFDAIESTGELALAEMRRLLGMLRASDEEIARAPQPSIAHVGELLEQIRATGLPVELSVQGEASDLPPGVDVSAYRIIQEALTNALKHAGPARARVLIRYEPDELAIEIIDDGAGDAAPTEGGHGVIGMRERVSVFGGDLAAGPRPEGGYALRARLPLASAR